MDGNYFLIDGSALMAQIRALRREVPIYRGRKLCPRAFMQYWMMSLRDLHSMQYKRATFYFADGDTDNVSDCFEIPDHKLPGHIRDLEFKYCGQKLKKSSEFDKFVEENVPDKFKGRFSKSEKGIDIEICCDAFRLASIRKLDRIFLLTNDDDFLPFCRTMKQFGSNVSIIHLSNVKPPNISLLRESDTFDIVEPESLQRMFFPLRDTGEEPEIAVDVKNLKPDALPSDLLSIDSGDIEDSE